MDDTTLASKFGGNSNTLLLSKEKRIKLWKGEGQKGEPWAWFWDMDTGTKWWEFWYALSGACKRDGFEVSLVLLYGPNRIGGSVVRTLQ